MFDVYISTAIPGKAQEIEGFPKDVINNIPGELAFHGEVRHNVFLIIYRSHRGSLKRNQECF